MLPRCIEPFPQLHYLPWLLPIIYSIDLRAIIKPSTTDEENRWDLKFGSQHINENP